MEDGFVAVDEEGRLVSCSCDKEMVISVGTSGTLTSAAIDESESLWRLYPVAVDEPALGGEAIWRTSCKIPEACILMQRREHFF